jgi:hypothetical protein
VWPFRDGHIVSDRSATRRGEVRFFELVPLRARRDRRPPDCAAC